MNSLEMATIDQLIEELASRATAMLLTIAIPDEQEGCSRTIGFHVGNIHHCIGLCFEQQRRVDRAFDETFDEEEE